MSKYSIPAIDAPVYSNILGHYSKHKVRMVEQSIHAYRLPSWNSDKGVIFDYMNWSPTAFQDKFGITSYKTKLVDQEGNVYFFNSQREAISATGIHSRTFTRSVNITPPHYIIAPINTSLFPKMNQYDSQVLFLLERKIMDKFLLTILIFILFLPVNMF